VSGPRNDVARVLAPPLVFYLGGLGIGVLFDQLVPGYDLPGGAPQVIGLALLPVGAAILAWSVVTMRRAGTAVSPHKSSSTIVTKGPYHYSRNPIYLADAVLYVGLALALRSAVALALLPVVLAAIRYGVIAREERYLERAFGEPYRSYKGRVRRWL
jgi:protein-S-isoprenylcysteine O-methyltransferase Ste14